VESPPLKRRVVYDLLLIEDGLEFREHHRLLSAGAMPRSVVDSVPIEMWSAGVRRGQPRNPSGCLWGRDGTLQEIHASLPGRVSSPSQASRIAWAVVRSPIDSLRDDPLKVQGDERPPDHVGADP
jgi:hypothetical protein